MCVAEKPMRIMSFSAKNANYSGNTALTFHNYPNFFLMIDTGQHLMCPPTKRHCQESVTLRFMAFLKLSVFKKLIFAQNTPPQNNGFFQKRTLSTILEQFL